MDKTRSQNKALIAIIVVVLLVAAASVVMAMDRGQEQTATSNETTSKNADSNTDTSTGSNTTATDAGAYEDGTYQSTGAYRTPGGQESIGVTVTLAGGVITDASITQNASGGEAEEYQERFTNAYKSEVVGKR
jgi:flagellar basal body-associated protein FliL